MGTSHSLGNDNYYHNTFQPDSHTQTNYSLHNFRSWGWLWYYWDTSNTS